MFFGSKSPTYERVGKLADAGYLKRWYVTQVVTAPAASPMVFTLGQLGANVLVNGMGYDPSEINYATSQTTEWRTLQHLLQINDVRAAIYRACRDHPDFELTTWRGELSFRKSTDEVTYQKGKRQVTAPVYPDGYFAIATPRGNAHCFLEVDRATESLARFRDQIRIYQAYTESGQYQERFATSSLRILVVTTGWKRAENLMRVTAEVKASSRYWFTTLSIITPETVLFDPIWRKLTDDMPQPFFSPLSLEA